MRSPAEMDIIVIDITNRCFLSCSNCTRAIAHQTTRRELSPDQLRSALRSLKGWWQPGRVVGLIGGEPTLHSQFSEMCKVFREEWNPGADPVHGREPIADFNQFAEQRLWDRSNGRGLWTSFGPRFIDHYETVMDTFSHWNPNDHSAGGVHQTGLVDAKEMCEALGIPWEDFPKYRDACWVQNTWSGSITPKGNYFCEHAGTLDLLYNDGKHAWKDEPGWWRRTPDQFGDQIHLCEMCSLCLPGPSAVDSVERDILGKNHVVRLELVGSPAVKKKRFAQFDPEVHREHRTVVTKDNYTAGPRVSTDNRSMMPRKLSAVVVCVGRSEHLRQTLAHNAGQVDELIVVTHPDDRETLQEIGSAYIGTGKPFRGEGDEPHKFRITFSRRVYDRDFAFNKGAMLNDGLKALAPDADWVVLTDADCFLPANLREYVRTHALNPGVLYGAVRGDGGGLNAEPNGYFQLFNRRASAIRDRWPAVMSEEFCSAGGIDSWFMQQFPAGKRHVIPELAVTHIDHGGELGAGWNGTATGPRWRQVEMVTPHGIIPVPVAPRTAERLRLTDTLHGETWEGPVGNIPPDILSIDSQGFIFKGKPIGHHHVHVAAWCG